MGTGPEPEPDRETDQDMVPEPKDEEQEEHAASVSKPGGKLQLRVRGRRSLPVSGAASTSASSRALTHLSL